MAFRLLCLRHGRTAWNALGRFQGQSDIPLDDTGREQAAQTAAALAGVAIDYAVSSDLARAVETAKIVLGARPLELCLDQDLRERNFGRWEGLTWVEIVERHPELAELTVMNARVFEPPGGEAFAETKARAAAAFHRLREYVPAGGTALLVAHAGLLHALLDELLGAGRDDFMITPASVLELAIDGDRAVYVPAGELADSR